MTAIEERQFLTEQRKKLEDILAERPDKDGIKREIRQHDSGEMSVELANLDTQVALLDSDYQRKRDARIALWKMDRGTYLDCSESECEKDISIRRLKAVPQALVCIQCKDLNERGDEYSRHHEPAQLGDLFPQTA